LTPASPSRSDPVSSKRHVKPVSGLAINGGPRARTRPEVPMFPGGLDIGMQEQDAVSRVLAGKRLIRFYGPDDPDGENVHSEVDSFEFEFAARIRAPFALGVTSGTAALITSLAALGIGPGDEVIIPAYTFIASAAAILAVGAIPVIAEVDDSLTLDPAGVRDVVTRHTKALMPVHMRGMPACMDELMSIAREHGLRVVEDVAQAAGASYGGRPLGSIGDVGAFSLQMHKIITTGEGGVLTTSDPQTLFRAKCFHDSASEWRGAAWQDPDPAVRATFVAFPGVNFRMAEITGAIGRVQLSRLDGLLTRMRSHKTALRSALVDTGRVELRRVTDAGEAATAVVFFAGDPLTANRASAALNAEGVAARVLYVEGEHDWHVYACWRDVLAKRTWNPQGYPFSMAHRDIEYRVDMCPRSLGLLARAVHINVPPQLTELDVDETAAALRKVVLALC
jgi:8-amino-3,8-dideoxy-alpha-D-manno-octulosonate transaminase